MGSLGRPRHETRPPDWPRGVVRTVMSRLPILFCGADTRFMIVMYVDTFITSASPRNVVGARGHVDSHARSCYRLQVNDIAHVHMYSHHRSRGKACYRRSLCYQCCVHASQSCQQLTNQASKVPIASLCRVIVTPLLLMPCLCHFYTRDADCIAYIAVHSTCAHRLSS